MCMGRKTYKEKQDELKYLETTKNLFNLKFFEGI